MDKTLRIGKLGVNELSRSVRKRLGKTYAPDACQDLIRLASDPITIGSVLSGKLAVTAVVNDLSAMRSEPLGIETILLLPPGTEESELRAIEDDIRNAAEAEHIFVLGGHTEVTPAVTKTIVCASGIGRPFRQTESSGTADITSEITAGLSKISPPRCKCCRNSHILMTKSAGLEAMALLGFEREEELLQKFPASLVKISREAVNHLSVREEAAVAAGFNGTGLCINLSEGGLYAALWSLAEMTGRGFTVDLTKVPILQEMIEIANYYDFDPYMCESAGSLLITVREDRAEDLIREIENHNIPTYDIGVLTDTNDKLIVNGDEVRNLDRPQADSIRSIGL